MVDKTNNTPAKTDPNTETGAPDTSTAGTAGVASTGAAETAASAAMMMVTLHLQGVAARLSMMGEAAKAGATVHD